LKFPYEGMTSGPDGYAMELIAWGLEKKGVMSSAEFVNLGIQTRAQETQTVALRGIARAVNAVEPGLYRSLRELQYGREAWQQGLQQVYAAITR
jgi:hypothetical protein